MPMILCMYLTMTPASNRRGRSITMYWWPATAHLIVWNIQRVIIFIFNKLFSFPEKTRKVCDFIPKRTLIKYCISNFEGFRNSHPWLQLQLGLLPLSYTQATNLMGLFSCLFFSFSCLHSTWLQDNWKFIWNLFRCSIISSPYWKNGNSC